MASNSDIPVTIRSSGRRRKPVIPFDEVVRPDTVPEPVTTKRKPEKPPLKPT